MIENGRLAIEVLEGDVVHAGFWGAHTPEFDDQTRLPSRRMCRPRSRTPATPMADPWYADERGNLIGIPMQVYDESAAVCGGVYRRPAGQHRRAGRAPRRALRGGPRRQLRSRRQRQPVFPIRRAASPKRRLGARYDAERLPADAAGLRDGRREAQVHFGHLLRPRLRGDRRRRHSDPHAVAVRAGRRRARAPAGCGDGRRHRRLSRGARHRQPQQAPVPAVDYGAR